MRRMVRVTAMPAVVGQNYRIITGVILCRRSGPAGIFPLRFGRQPIGTVGKLFLGQSRKRAAEYVGLIPSHAFDWKIARISRACLLEIMAGIAPDDLRILGLRDGICADS